jgi:hypothetical protein
VNGQSTVSAAQTVAADTDRNTAEVAVHSSSSSSSSSRASSISNNSGIGANGNGNANGNGHGHSVQLYRRQRSPVITQFKLLLARSWRQVQSAVLLHYCKLHSDAAILLGSGVLSTA